jgi:hypothetical protein
MAGSSSGLSFVKVRVFLKFEIKTIKMLLTMERARCGRRCRRRGEGKGGV